MRLPFPERLPLFHVSVFCAVLCLVQLMQGTTLFFSAGTATFILLATVAFNMAGGLTRVSGAFIFGYAMVGVVFGIVFKVVVAEPGQSNLLQPERTIEVYVATIAAILLTTYLNRRLQPKRSFSPRFASVEDMRLASVGCFFAGVFPIAVRAVSNSASNPGAVRTVIGLFDVFLPLSILLGVTAEILRSKGRSSVTGVVLAASVLTFAQGVLTYSKQGMFYAFVAWALPAAAHRYKVNPIQVVGLCLTLAWMNYYLVPYSQYGRNFRDETASFQENLKTNLLLLSNLDQVRKVYLQNTEEVYAGSAVGHYYNQPQGIVERTQMLTPDDAIIDYTDNNAAFGLLPTLYSIYNIVPHIVWPNKPAANFGTIYAHELGMLSEDDDTTGISFSPSGDAYHQAKWVGVLVVLPLLMLLLFYTNDAVLGDTRESPVALLSALSFLHAAQEGGIVQCVGEATTVIVVLYATAFVMARVMPLLAGIVLGPSKRANGATAAREMPFGPLLAAQSVENASESLPG